MDVNLTLELLSQNFLENPNCFVYITFKTVPLERDAKYSPELLKAKIYI